MARPYICRLSILMRLTWPSTGPEFHGWVRPAVTAARSCSMPVTKEFRPGRPMARAWASHRGEPFAAAAGQHDGEAADGAVQGVQFGAAAQDGGQLRPGLLIEAVRVLGEPGDGVAD